VTTPVRYVDDGVYTSDDSVYTSNVYTSEGSGYFPTPRPRATQETWRRTLSIIVTWAIIVTTLAIWLRGGALATFRGGLTPTLITLGALAGWIAALIFLFNVLLMARVPFFEFGFGRDHIVYWHRKLGFWSFWFLLAHIVLKVAGWASRLNANPFRQLADIITTWHGMIMATIATLAIILAVIMISLNRFRAAMKYESWHLWHLLAYPAVFLALPHMFGSGTALAGNVAAQRFWWALWIITGLSVLIWRVILPLIRSNRHDVRVAEVVPDGSRGVTVKMTGRDLDRLGARGGSFFTFRYLDGPGSLRGHPFSLSMPPTNDTMQIAVRVVGDGTERIAGLKPGTKVIIEGPMGRVSGDMRVGHRLLMFGAGAGVGPMVAILGDQEWAPGEATLITRDNVHEETMMIPEITDLVERRGLIWRRIVGGIPTSGSTWLAAGENGAAPDGAALIQSWLAEDPAHPGFDSGVNYTNTDVYVCGPPIWMTALKKDLTRAGIPASQIHIEEFAY